MVELGSSEFKKEVAAFRKLRDELNSGPRKAVMIKLGTEWTSQYIDTIEVNPEVDLGGVEYNESAPDLFVPGNLLGFIYPGYNCPAVLGYGHRDEDEIRIMKYIWRVNGNG